MPRLFGYREHLNLNLWDAFRPKDLLPRAPRAAVDYKMFGDANIGDPMLTNMVIGHQIASDQTMVVMSMFARTNVDIDASPELRQAWMAWTNATVATLVVGSRPVGIEHPLSTLLGPRTFGNMCGYPNPDIGNINDDLDDLAERLYQACIARNECPGTWSTLHPVQRESWRNAAAALPLYRPYCVPVRQNFAVHVTTDQRALEVLLKVLPERIAPCPLVWVHILGNQNRDVT